MLLNFSKTNEISNLQNICTFLMLSILFNVSPFQITLCAKKVMGNMVLEYFLGDRCFYIFSKEKIPIVILSMCLSLSDNIWCSLVSKFVLNCRFLFVHTLFVCGEDTPFLFSYEDD